MLSRWPVPLARDGAAWRSSSPPPCWPAAAGRATSSRSGRRSRTSRRATAQKDYARICKQLFAARLVEQLEQVNLPCEQALKRAFSNVQDPRVSVGTVKVDGTSASAQVRSSATGEKPSEDTVELVKVDGRWRINSLGTQ